MTVDVKAGFADFVKSLDEAVCRAVDSYDELTGVKQNPGDLTLRFMSRAIPMAGLMASMAAAPVVTVGAAGIGILLANTKFRDNRHKRAGACIGISALIVPHLAAHDAANVSGIISLSIGALRAMTMTIIPDENITARKKAGWAYFLTGASTIAIDAAMNFANGTFTPAQTAGACLPAAAMAMGTLADAMPSSQSRYARLCRTAGAAFVSTYDFALAKVYMTGIFNVLGGASLIQSIKDYDVPTVDRDGRKLTWRESLSRYATAIMTSQPPDGLSRDDLKVRATQAASPKIA